METRVFRRETHEDFCTQPGCRFQGKHAAQGVCFNTDSLIGVVDWSYIERLEKYAAQSLKEVQRTFRGPSKHKAYVRYLESTHVCETLNATFNLDECIRLRAENAILKRKLGKWK